MLFIKNMNEVNIAMHHTGSHYIIMILHCGMCIVLGIESWTHCQYPLLVKLPGMVLSNQVWDSEAHLTCVTGHIKTAQGSPRGILS